MAEVQCGLWPATVLLSRAPVCASAGVYLVTLGSLFAAVETDILKAGDARSWLRRVGADRVIDLEKINPSAGNFALAWILAKFTEPMRVLITATATPRVAVLIRNMRATKR